MYKILVTTTYKDHNTSSIGHWAYATSSIHTLVIEFSSLEQAKEAVKKIMEKPVMGYKQDAILLF